MDKNILIIGSVALDSIETPFGKRESILGGSCTYSSFSASFFNKYISIVAVIGRDFPKRYISLFKKINVNIEGLKKENGRTFRWKGNYNYDLNSPLTVYTHLNVFEKFNPVIPDGFKTSEFVFLANIDPDLQKNVLLQISKKPQLVLCDTMNYWIEKKRKSLLKLIKHVDVFLLNEGEARQLSGETNLKKAARYILSCGVPSVIIKKGEHGVLFFSKHLHFSAPAYLLENIKDPTGAGDTFAGGMLGFLSQASRINNDVIRRSIIYGSIMASYVVEDFSINRLLALDRKDINKRYQEFRRITSF